MQFQLRSAAALCVAFLVFAGQASAAPRGIRIEFGTEWGNLGAIGTSGCPGTSASNVLVVWNGYTFSGQSNPQFGFNVDTYCQQTVAPDFNRFSFFHGDELILAAMVGANLFGQVSGIRYSYLGGPRFSNPNGFQWAFYFFPRAVTVVGLYGLTGIPLTDAHSYITGPDGPVWQGASNGYDGEYFCFRDVAGPGGIEHRFIGTWNGTLNPITNACLQAIATLHLDGFED